MLTRILGFAADHIFPGPSFFVYRGIQAKWVCQDDVDIAEGPRIYRKNDATGVADVLSGSKTPIDFIYFYLPVHGGVRAPLPMR